MNYHPDDYDFWIISKHEDSAWKDKSVYTHINQDGSLTFLSATFLFDEKRVYLPKSTIGVFNESYRS